MLSRKNFAKVPGYEVIDTILYRRTIDHHTLTLNYIIVPILKIAIRKDFHGPSRLPKKSVPIQLYMYDSTTQIFVKYDRFVYLVKK